MAMGILIEAYSACGDESRHDDNVDGLCLRGSVMTRGYVGIKTDSNLINWQCVEVGRLLLQQDLHVRETDTVRRALAEQRLETNASVDHVEGAGFGCEEQVE